MELATNSTEVDDVIMAEFLDDVDDMNVCEMQMNNDDFVIDHVDVTNMPDTYDVNDNAAFKSKFKLQKALRMIA
ncbi:hypothetical protein L484_008051 [Morus notabilis]|uniref:Uncharacterized protein n=1 Tax=Morus notabilis TaxID=981085 RepID=W9QJI4_9ROSA|nr:hypothetical protein L484_008051 [Morus notabilis]